MKLLNLEIKTERNIIMCGSKCHGTFSYYTFKPDCRIRIERLLTKKWQATTLFHELIHYFLYMVGIPLEHKLQRKWDVWWFKHITASKSMEYPYKT